MGKSGLIRFKNPGVAGAVQKTGLYREFAPLRTSKGAMGVEAPVVNSKLERSLWGGCTAGTHRRGTAEDSVEGNQKLVGGGVLGLGLQLVEEGFHPD